MRILLVEDDEKLCDSLAFQLKHNDFEVDICFDGEDALYYMEQNIHDLILLDRMLPHIDGIALLRKIRLNQNFTPVIILTALGELNDKITGLDAGADDYLVKPFDFEELMARIRSISRRPHNLQQTDALIYGDIHYLTSSHELCGDDGKCILSKKEGALLEFFLRNHGQILPRMTILMKVWGPDAEVEDGNLDNYMHFVRRRLKIVSHRITIKTIRGIGYRIEDKINHAHNGGNNV